jgi:anti-sigma B factor antagonist/stage II sporulation protein AA (anti-sigma F factor antagonist)
MDVGAQSYSNVIVVSPSGRVDHQSADQLGAAMAPHVARCERAQCKLVLDLSGVDYMSSAGLRVLMVAAKRARAQGGTMVVSGLGETLREIFQISRFDRVFTVYDGLREAIAGLEPDALADYERGAPSPASRC